MKKAIYLLAATALMASCTQEVLIDQPQPQPEKSRRIGFDTFVEKATRTEDLNLDNPTALNNFYTTFNVYGWKTVGNDVTCVFNNIPVEYFATDAQGKVVYKEEGQKPSDEWNFVAKRWYYENIRYWDKMASSYLFSAFTPTPAGVAFNCTSDGLIEIGTEDAPVTVDDTNLLKDTPSTDLLFKGFKKDYMTAQSEEKSLDKVTLNFSHLQAKMNVRIKLDDDMKTAQEVKVTEIKIHNLNDKGYYTNATITVTDEAGTTTNVPTGVTGWTTGTATADYVLSVTNDYLISPVEVEEDENQENTEVVTEDEEAEEVKVSYHNHYVLEQLIIPQSINKYTEPTPTAAEVDEGSTDDSSDEGTGDGSDEGTGDGPDEGDGQGSEGATPAVVTLPVSLSEYEVACVYVEYTIGEEIFKSYTPLANIFSTEPTYNFEGGKQYTLNITIGPKPINFRAVVTPWADAIDENLPMD